MRSKLFVPASRPELFTKALASEADALSFDLEDAVLPARKSEARQALAEFLASAELSNATQQRPKQIIVRINPLDSEFLNDDLRVVCHERVDIINLPKVESADDIRRFATLLSRAQNGLHDRFRTRILANIETPAALANAAEIATVHPGVWGLQLGLGDMFEPLRIARYDAQNVHAILFALRMASAQSGCVVYDSAYADVANIDGFRAEALQARRLGFLGKSCIHPKQIAVANEVFRPTDAEIAWARKVLDASARNDFNGAYLVDGVMIDAPFVARARDVLRQAQAS